MYDHTKPSRFHVAQKIKINLWQHSTKMTKSVKLRSIHRLWDCETSPWPAERSPISIHDFPRNAKSPFNHHSPLSSSHSSHPYSIDSQIPFSQVHKTKYECIYIYIYVCISVYMCVYINILYTDQIYAYIHILFTLYYALCTYKHIYTYKCLNTQMI